jgi:hypothetical protein
MGHLMHRIGRLLVAVVLVASGCYVFVYLSRWEWNRALMAGFFFLAAEVALIADMTLGRIRELDREVARTRDAEQVAALAARLRAARPDTPGPFAWLSGDPDRLNVFLPILIGAGVILSALSFLVEQVSRVTAVPVAEHELARGLAAMALPAAGLSPTGRFAGGDPSAGLPRPTSQRMRWLVFAGLAAGIAALLLVLSQSLLGVSAPADVDRALQLDLVVQRRDLAMPDRDLALALWATCRTRVPQEVELASLEPVDPADPAHLRMVLSPAPGRTDTVELVGCIEDATVERSWTSVVRVADVPTRS